MDGQRAEEEAVGVAGDPGPADFAKAEEPKEVAGDAGGHLDESRVAVDDPTAERSSLVEDDTNMVSVLGSDGDSFVEQDGRDTGSAAAACDYGNEPKEDAGVGVRLDDVGAAADDSVEVDASLIDDAMNILPVGGGASFDGSQGIGGGVHGEAAGFVLDVQDDGPQMDRSVTVSGDNGENVQDEGALLDVVATTVFNDAEADLVKASDSVLEESTGMDIHAPPGDDNEEMVAMACDAATDEDGRKVDAVSSPSDHNEELAIGAADVDARDEDMQLGTVDLSRDDNVAKESVAAPVNGTDQEDLKIDAAITAGNEDGEDVKADNTDRVPEEVDTVSLSRDNSAGTKVGAVGDDGTNEEGVQMDVRTATGGVSEEDGKVVQNVVEDVVGGSEEAETIGLTLTGDDKAEKEAATVGDNGADEEGMQIDAVTTTGDEDEEDGKADENVVEDDDGVSEEAVAGSEDIPEEDAVQMDEDEDDDDEPPPLAKKGGGRRKRGRASSKAQAVVKPSVRKKDDEEVCFICFDGGDLVVCDRRGCPKAYHPSCVNRDDEFFKSKGRWNCGWHICSNCQKPARHMCFTCTYSLCIKCIKETKFVAVRANKGFCETCMNTVMLIENKEAATEQMDVDFDDKTSFWYLFKDYWLNLKEKLSLTFEEISAAKSQKNGSLVIRENDLSEPHDTNDEEEGNSDSSSVRHLESNSKRKGRKRSNQAANDDSSVGKDSSRKSTKRGLSGGRDAKGSSGRKVRKLSKRALSSDHRPKESESVGTSTSSAEETSWASKELLDFVANMKNGDKSVLSQFEVQSLLLEYIKRENLRDPRRKSQIICDSLLKSLFGKARVGHFEMLKLLESHFLMSEVSPVGIDDNHGGVVDPDPSLDGDGNSEASIVMSSEKKKKSRKYDQKALQTNLDDYAAIDNHNIGLMYLRRNLLEELISEVDTFDEKVLGTFVRIRISGTGQRQDIYRLVQIVGTGTAPELYKCGKKSTDITLEILNLDKKEVITIDITSNQEFTEEECKRLRQSIKCGFIPRLTVGEVYEKAKVLQSVKVNDWIESEKMRLGHLRDRASDMGHRKELRECVEKLQLLSTPEERVRRLNEDPEVHADHTMDPDYESPEEQEEDTERRSFNKSRGSFFRKDGNPVSPGKGEGRSPAHRDSKANWESNRNTWGESSTHIESPLGRRPSFSSHSESKTDSPAHTVKVAGNAPHGLSGVSSEITGANAGSGGTQSSQSVINESEKIWQYVDPTGKIQGPFSILQLRKWNSSGYFPPNLKIWKSTEKQDDSILLTDALLGKFEKDLPPWEPPVGSSSNVDARPRSDSRFEESTKSGEQPSKSAVLNSSQSLSGRVGQINDTANLGSATIQSSTQGYYGMQNSQAAYAVQQSLTGSWNTSASQFGTTINPMTLSQPSMGNFSVGQTAAVGGQLTSVQGPATISAEVVNSQSQPQNQIASLSQSDGRLADGNDSKLGADASHERTRPLGEGLGLAAAQPGAVQSNTQQHEEARSHLQNDASNSVNPSQLMSTPSAQAVQPSPTTMAGGDTQNSGWAQLASTSGQSQGAANMTWGTTIQGNANMGWEMMGQNNMNMSWGGPAQSATGYNMALTMPAQPNAVSNMGWVTPNPGNTNMNMMWAATQGQGTPNAAAMMGTQMQGVAMAPWGAVTQGNTNSYSGWGAQVGNMNQNAGWGAPMQSNAGPSTGNGTSQGNNNMNWNSPSGNTNWNNQQRDNGGRHSGHGGDSGGRSWRSQSGGDGGSWGNRRGVCFSMLERGYCRKGESCRFSHSIPNDGYPSRNDRHFDRQNSGNERRYDRQNERTDRQFDRQSSGNERHDDMDNSRDSDRHDERQTDRSQSRERQ